uniref:hypothetical protein n=1 Tax=Thaumasiovibrio occultus TaxID=1891184 RepID=UPI00131E7A1E|nr:hypothetical protein [Thaumasiovibrio occultus]
MFIKSIFAGILLMFSTLCYSEEFIIHADDKQLIVSTEELSQMMVTHYVTALPWTNGREIFSGVLFETLFEHYDLPLPETVGLIALNDYRTTISREDILKYQPIIAFQRNGEPMSVRNKGPFWVIFSLEIYPELDNINYHSKMIWQLTQIYDQF